jgi:hypothetical protein
VRGETVSVAETCNSRGTIFRGTTVNWAGDEVDANIPVAEHLPATLIETGHKTQDPSSPTPRTIREITLRVPFWCGLTDEDRWYDETTGDTYIVISVTKPPTTIGAPVDLVASLKRITANSV